MEPSNFWLASTCMRRYLRGKARHTCCKAATQIGSTLLACVCASLAFYTLRATISGLHMIVL